MADLFPDAPRRPRRVLMRVVDASDCEGNMVDLECPRCRHRTGWQTFETKRAALTQPCPNCNERTEKC